MYMWLFVCWCLFDTRVRLEVVVIVRADMPDTAAGTNVVVRVPMPRSTVSVNTEVRAADPAR